MCKNYDITFYDCFDDFIKHDMDAVVLANYANEHARFAIAAMKAGKHIFSEVLPVQTMKEAVELIETVEETGKIYAYGENYCYMPATYEMKRLYGENKIGEFEYGECEYLHNCEPIWPEREQDEKCKAFGHGGSDYYVMYSFAEKILGNPNADIIDVYEAIDMFLPGMFAYRSILNGGISMDIPNLRNKDEREKWRNDTACTDPAVAGNMLLPTSPNGTPDIEDGVYEAMKQKWLDAVDSNSGYTHMAFTQGSEDKE